MEGDQAGPSAARRLLDLPVSCLHHIVNFMDGQTKFQFFRTSKGSQDEQGCAVLVLRASKLQCTYTVQPQNMNSRPAMCSLLQWASQISADMELKIAHFYIPPFHLLDVLHNLLLYPDARATPSGRVLGKPATYPGITSLHLGGYTCSSLMPGLVADAFPNLNSFSADWRPDTSQPLGPVVQDRLKYLQHIDVTLHATAHLMPAARKHVAQQLSQLPSLTSIGVDNHVLRSMPAAALAKLKQLRLHAFGDPPAGDTAALKACSQLEGLELFGDRAGDWVQALPLCAPSIRLLSVSLYTHRALSDQHMAPLLALPHLTSLTVGDLGDFSDDYSSAPCSWKHFQCRGSCSNDITKLPLHALDSPVQCSWFKLRLSGHAADLAAIKAAKAHLLRCGGIRMEWGTLSIDIAGGSVLTKEQAAEVLAEWATYLLVPNSIVRPLIIKPIIKDAVLQVWPGAELECW